MIFLLIETATPVCSVALAKDQTVLAELHSTQPNAHSSMLAPFIDQLFAQTHLSPSQLNGVCVSSGPGSYTGLRIGVSTAKGFCYALSKPLMAVPTLRSMASQYYAEHPDYDGLVCPMIDARRMECYAAFYSREGERRAVGADIIEEGIYDAFLAEGPVTFLGDGAEKTRPLLGVHPNALFDTQFRISAAGLLPLAWEKMQKGEFEDVAYFEPYYLKEFVAKKSVVRGLSKSL